MTRWLLLGVLGASLASCGGTGRILSYGTDLADAKVLLGAAEFQVYVHPTDHSILVQRSLRQIAGGHDNPVEFRAAGAQFLAPVACETTGIALVAAGSFEITYRCPDGIDLPSVVASQRAALRGGASLRNVP